MSMHPNLVIGDLVPKEEIERVMKEYDETHIYPSCGLCKHAQIIILKFRRWKGEIRIKECKEQCELDLDFEGTYPDRVNKCSGYEKGENQYLGVAGNE